MLARACARASWLADDPDYLEALLGDRDRGADLELVLLRVVGVHDGDIGARVRCGEGPPGRDLARAERAKLALGQVNAGDGERLGGESAAEPAATAATPAGPAATAEAAATAGVDRRDFPGDPGVGQGQPASGCRDVVQPGDGGHRRGTQRPEPEVAQRVDVNLRARGGPGPGAGRSPEPEGPRAASAGRRSAGDGHVSAYSVQRVQHAALRVPHASGQRRYRDDQPDSDGKAECDQYRLAHPAAQFAPQVGEKHMSSSGSRAPRRGPGGKDAAAPAPGARAGT